MSQIERVVKCFRCGYCGQPTDKDGYVLNEQQIKAIGADGLKWDMAEQTHGECCVNQQQEREMVQITREMAMDAQDMSLEGQLIEW